MERVLYSNRFPNRVLLGFKIGNMKYEFSEANLLIN